MCTFSLLLDYNCKKKLTCEDVVESGWWLWELCAAVLISFSGTRPGFFFFNTAKIEDSLSGKDGISSSTVAWKLIDTQIRQCLIPKVYRPPWLQLQNNYVQDSYKLFSSLKLIVQKFYFLAENAARRCS